MWIPLIIKVKEGIWYYGTKSHTEVLLIILVK